jgi:phytoene desaturase
LKKKAIIIGSGFAGLSAACFMARDGWAVTVVEKHNSPGGRARQLKEHGFTFDMGPSWYWMPDVFEKFFGSFGKNVSDYYSLSRLDPSYRVFWRNGFNDIPATRRELGRLFETWETGSSKQLDNFLVEAAFKYRIGMQKLVYKPGLSISEFADLDVLKGLARMDVFTSIKQHISKFFKDERIRQLLEFPVLFLGALPENTPALYSLMNYADIEGGTWYPSGGMYSIVDAMHKLAEELGVAFLFNEEVSGFTFNSKRISAVKTRSRILECDVVVAGADYHHIEQDLLPPPMRDYTELYWNTRQLSPSCLIYFVGLNTKLNGVQHHNLFFDVPFDSHAAEIYKTNAWPAEPLFYLSVNSKTDAAAAPDGGENLFFLVPVSAGLEGDTSELREKYFNILLARLEQHTGQQISDNVVFKKSFAYTDFVNEYHSFRGNAYGLANTLKQTAILKPRCRSRKVQNLFYTGQLTVPGPGVPPSLISGEVVAGVASRIFKSLKNELRSIS